MTPQGYVDTPFIYVYDGTGLTDGSSYQRLSVRLEGDDDFLLRRVAGLPAVAASMVLYDGGGQPRSAAAVRAGNNWTIAPEVRYPAQGELLFDLATVARASIACGTTIYTAYLAFQGIKRRRATWPTLPPAIETPYTYSETLTIDWYRYISLPAAVVEHPRVFRVQVDDYDFVLQRLRLCNGDGTALTGATIQLRLYDDQDRALSSAPVNQQVLNSAVAGWGSCFPAPAVIYRRGSTLRFDVTSMVCNTDVAFPKDIRLELTGYRRIPRG